MIGQSPNDLIILLRTYFLLSIKNPVFPKEKENDDCNSSLYFSSDDENDEQNYVTLLMLLAYLPRWNSALL